MATWREKRNKLYRGDDRGGVCLPDPAADPSIVRHVLYLDGAGRATPYHSTSESRDIAQRFAGRRGKVYATKVARAKDEGVRHISRLELLNLLKGRGQGNASWSNPLQVMMARKYVEQYSEHLLDYQSIGNLDEEDLRKLIDRLFVVD